VSADNLSRQGQALASALLAAIDNADITRGAAIKALQYCSQHYGHRTLVETALAVAGCGPRNLFSDAELELYCDITRSDEDVGYIAKGWEDPGFRLGQIITIPKSLQAEIEDVKKHCDRSGIVMSWSEHDAQHIEVTFEYVIYTTGFDGRTFAQALSALMDCSTRFASK
jgi:hypothetical protein